MSAIHSSKADLERLSLASSTGPLATKMEKDVYENAKTPDDIEGGAITSGGAPDLYSKDNIGLLAQYAAVGVIYYAFPRTVYPFLNKYLYLDGYQSLAAITLVRMPWSFKVFFGIIHDSFPIMGFRRKPYMIIGWVVCCAMLILMTFLPVGDPFFLEPEYRDIENLTYLDSDGANISVELSTVLKAGEAGIDGANWNDMFNWAAPGTASKYIVLMMFASIGYVFADVAADGMVVEFAQREPEATRGTTQTMIYLTRTVFGIFSTALISFGMNGKEYGGQFDFSFTFNFVMGVLAVFCALTIPVTHFFLKEEKVAGESFSSRLADMWKIVQQRAVWQIMALRFFGGIFENFPSPPEDIVKSEWAQVAPLNEGIFSIVGMLVFAATLYCVKQYGLQWNWRYIAMITMTLSVMVDSIAVMLTIWDVVRSEWFWLGVPIVQELPDGVNFVVSTYVIVEIAEPGYEGMTYGLLTTISNLSSPFTTTIANNVSSMFDAFKEDIKSDTTHVRTQVTYVYLISYSMKILSFCWLVLLPPQKKAAQELKKNGGSSKLAGAVAIGIFLFALTWSVTVNLLSIYESTACLKIAGGNGDC